MNKEEIEKRLCEIDYVKCKLAAELNELDNKPTPEQRLLGMFTGCTINIDEKKFTGRVFLMKGGKYFFEIGKTYLWCSDTNVWSVLEQEYDMNHYEIQTLIKNVMEEHFGMRGITPSLML